MRDYFASIVPAKVPGVPLGTTVIKTNKTAIFMSNHNGTPDHYSGVPQGTKVRMVPNGTSGKNQKVPLQAKETAVVPNGTPGTHLNWTYEQEERAAILEYGER